MGGHLFYLHPNNSKMSLTILYTESGKNIHTPYAFWRKNMSFMLYNTKKFVYSNTISLVMLAVKLTVRFTTSKM